MIKRRAPTAEDKSDTRTQDLIEEFTKQVALLKEAVRELREVVKGVGQTTTKD